MPASSSASVDRRQFLVRSGLVLGAGALGRWTGAPADARAAETATPARPLDWEAIRAQFNLSRDCVHMSAFYLASHPKPVREALEAHRRGLDENPIDYIDENIGRLEGQVRSAAGEYFGANPNEFAMTDSTTMGLGLVYGGMKLRGDQEILTTEHDHMATHASLRLRALRTGASVRRISLYQSVESTSEDEIVESIVKAVRPQTRIIAVTWVHSSTGLKIPVGRIAGALKAVNARRSEEDRALLCVDGVHGFGAENATAADLGCDFFISGCHKWLFGPRGTGLVWGSEHSWSATTATIPSFDGLWRKQDYPPAAAMTPGGFHSFEHRWALPAAFRFHLEIGKAKVAQRIHELNRQCKEGLAKMRHVKLYTPVSDKLSAGIICFDVRGLSAAEVVDRLRARKIFASVTPYATKYARLAPSLLTSPEEVETTLRAVRALA